MVNFRAFETIMEAKNNNCIIERYIYNNETVLKIDGQISDVLRQKIKTQKAAIIGILGAGWIVDKPAPSFPEWAIATRPDIGAVLSWKIGCDESIDAWIPERRKCVGGPYLFESRIDDQAWRARKATFKVLTTREGGTMKAYSEAGELIDSWECRHSGDQEEDRQPEPAADRQEEHDQAPGKTIMQSLFKVSA